MERLRRLKITGEKSKTPRTKVYPTPGKSFARPPLTKTRLYLDPRYPIPGILPVTLSPVVKFTFATIRIAEFGFLGDIIAIFVIIPLT